MIERTRRSLMLLVLLGTVVAGQYAFTSADEPKRPKTLDEALLEDLGGDPIEGLDRESPEAQPDKPRTTDRSKTLESADDGNPVLVIARRMRDVESRIALADCGDQTQRTQREILAELDELIKQARKSCGQCKPGDKKSCTGVQERKPVAQPCNKPGEKATGSNKGQTGRADPKTPEARRADVEQTKTLMQQLWGELPPREREQMLQRAAGEEFLPEYELLIEDYFRRLSEEKGSPSEPR